MESSTTNQITTPGNQNVFLAPEFPLQRRYEALRAYFVDEEPSADVARRFGYSPGFSASSVISSAMTRKNALLSSASPAAVLNPLPPATVFGIWS